MNLKIYVNFNVFCLLGYFSKVTIIGSYQSLGIHCRANIQAIGATCEEGHPRFEQFNAPSKPCISKHELKLNGLELNSAACLFLFIQQLA